ncbi:MAG: hypothetical protein KatS3mg076_0266 [Candidatus Binatia bacterium]|nr:MAG: hypothetical protein KatS3mg076_0266 [Candidatus Binatia bacterium]
MSSSRQSGLVRLRERTGVERSRSVEELRETIRRRFENLEAPRISVPPTPRSDRTPGLLRRVGERWSDIVALGGPLVRFVRRRWQDLLLLAGVLVTLGLGAFLFLVDF